MANVSLALYLAFALYSKVDALTRFSLPYVGFCEMAESVTVPRMPIGNRQLPPALTSMAPAEFSPQSASVADIEHSGADAARAKDGGRKLAASTISAKAATLEARAARILVLMQDPVTKVSAHNRQQILPREN